MTRTTDDLNPERFQPLGAPIRPAPAAPKEREVAPGVIQGTDGRLRTNLPLPKEKP